MTRSNNATLGDNAVELGRLLPTAKAKRRLLAILLSLVIVSVVFVSPVLISLSVGARAEWSNELPDPEQRSWWVQSTTWGNFGGTIYFCNPSGMYRFNPYNMTFGNRMLVSNTTWHEGAYDLVASEHGSFVYLTTNGPNGGVIAYQNNAMWNYTMYNITEDTSFRYIEMKSNSTGDYFFLGTENNGIAWCNRLDRQVTFRNTTHGLVSNYVTCLKLRGNTLLIGTKAGFSLYDFDNDMFVSQSLDDLEEIFEVNAIEYYPVYERIYVGTDTGLLVFQKDGANIDLVGPRLTQDDGLPHNDVHALQLDPNKNRVYIGTPRGLSYIDASDEPTGIVPMVTEEFSDVTVESILVSERGDRIYAGTSGTVIAIVLVPADILLWQGELHSVIVPLIALTGLLLVAALWGIVVYAERHEYIILDYGPAKILEIINDGENERVEFKSSFRYDGKTPRKSVKQEFGVVKAVAGFMNGGGGTLLIGVSDSGKRMGLDGDLELLESDALNDEMVLHDKFERELVDAIHIYGMKREHEDFLKPKIVNIDGAKVCVAHVIRSPTPVYFTKFVTNDGKVKQGKRFPVRKHRRTVLLELDEAVKWIKIHRPDLVK